MNLTLPQYRERIITGAIGGQISADARYDYQYIDSIINSGRAVLVRELYKEMGIVPPVYYQRYEPEYIPDAQESKEYALYSMPDLIAIDATSDGGGFFGTVTCDVPFTQVNNRNTLADYKRHRILKPGRRALVLVTKGRAEVYYKNLIKEFLIEGIFADPTSVPTFNVENDPYPIDAAAMSRLDDYILRIHLDRTQQAVTDRVANSRDDSVQPFRP